MNKFKVLLVDDELDFLELMKQRLESWGYEVATASTGNEAVKAVDKLTPQAVILDYWLPDLDGVATLKNIRKTDKDVPVVMFTAHPDEKVIKGTENLSLSAVIPKLSAYSDVHALLKTTLNMIEKGSIRPKPKK
jgi:DNA-binding response OmpR family regulator